MSERDNDVYMAKVAEQAERYEDMEEYMTRVAKLGVELTIEERNLLSVAFKNVIGSYRSSWRVLSSIKQKEEAISEMALQYCKKIESVLKTKCNFVLELIENDLIETAANDESKVFYLKMKGDYHRYLAEILADNERDEEAEKSNSAYKEATQTAVTLPSTHPIRLGLALNFSVFCYEIQNSREKACKLAKAAFDEAVADLDRLSEESYKDSTLIMQLLRDNLSLWVSEETSEQKQKEEELQLQDVDDDGVAA